MNKSRRIGLFNPIEKTTFTALNNITKLNSKCEMRCTCWWASLLIQIVIKFKSLLAAYMHELFQILTLWVNTIPMDASKNAFKCFLCTSHWLWNHTFRLNLLLRLLKLIGLTINLISFIFNFSYETGFFLHHTF